MGGRKECGRDERWSGKVFWQLRYLQCRRRNLVSGDEREDFCKSASLEESLLFSTVFNLKVQCCKHFKSVFWGLGLSGEFP